MNDIFEEYKWLVNCFIGLLWNKIDYLGSFATKEETDSIETWMTARMKQCAAKQAIPIIKSQRKKHRKTMPVFKGDSIELDSRFVDIQEGENSFDIWLELSSIGNKIKILIPIKKHKHFNKFNDDPSWSMSKSVRLRRSGYIDFFFFKKDVAPKSKGANVGVDIGINKMLTLSNGVVVGKDIKEKINEVNRKEQKSKAWYRALDELHSYINQEINRIDIYEIKTLVLEDLTGISHKTKNRVGKTTRRLIGHWNHKYIVDRIKNKCEVNRVGVVFVDPKYTSQTCRMCGHIDKGNRSGEMFKCKKCGFAGNADYLASLNILDRFAQESIVPVANGGHRNDFL
jgi:IS605 OrfB family transposase